MKKGKILSTREHALQRPDMYIGSIKTRKEKKLLYVDGKIISKEIDYNEGLERIFVEIFLSATRREFSFPRSPRKKLTFSIIKRRSFPAPSYRSYSFVKRKLSF